MSTADVSTSATGMISGGATSTVGAPGSMLDVDREDALLLELNVYIEGWCTGFDFGGDVVERLLYVDLLGSNIYGRGAGRDCRRWSL